MFNLTTWLGTKKKVKMHKNIAGSFASRNSVDLLVLPLIVVVIRPVTSLGHQEGRSVFWEGPKFFELWSIVNICPAHFSRGDCPPCALPGYGSGCDYAGHLKKWRSRKVTVSPVFTHTTKPAPEAELFTTSSLLWFQRLTRAVATPTANEKLTRSS